MKQEHFDTSEELWTYAYKLHYSDSDRGTALTYYNRLIEEFPTCKEVPWALAQIDNIEKERQRLGDIIFEKTERKPDVDSVIITTAPILEGYKVQETIDVVTAEYVAGINIFKDILASFSDTFGFRSETTEKILREARETVLLELKRSALDQGANAVIAVNLHYNEFSGKDKSMLIVVASGTAVKVTSLETLRADIKNEVVELTE